MCGIAGWLEAGVPTGELEARVARMMGAIAHRGPDGTGTWASPTGGLVLGHVRLAIIDPKGGIQPMADAGGGLRIVFNGCIYNYLELKEELEGLGYAFKTKCDTEVILQAYAAWGPECVTRFNGMWAFALWDERERTLFCSRDRLGIKPFYFVNRPGAFAWASEIKALVRAGAAPAEADPEGVRQYLTFQLCLGQKTMFRGVERLEPGHNLILKAGRPPEIRRFWDVSYAPDPGRSEAALIEELRALVSDSVRLRLRSDVPLGAHLSGGLDSSTVVCLARKHLGDLPLKTFTGAFREGAGFDETPHARAVSAFARTEAHEQYFGAADFAAQIEKIVWHMDEPAAGPGVFPQFLISRLAARHVKVVLGGQGGDELFLGYARYLVAHLEETLKGTITGTGAVREKAVAALEKLAPHLGTLKEYVPMLRSFWAEGLFEEPARRYFRLMDRFAESKAMISGEFQAGGGSCFEDFRRVFEASDAVEPVDKILYFDMKTHLQALLQVEDRTSMAWGLESRVPLLDYRLVERVSRIPLAVRFQEGRLKHFFRRVVEGIVPEPIRNRGDKMGFPVPLGTWMQGELRSFVGDTMLSARARQRGIFDMAALEAAIQGAQPYSRPLWGALCLELWYRTQIDG